MLRVLFVDDEPDLLKVGKLFLERTKEIFAETATSAEMAIEQMKIHQIDVIISDYLMPDIDGIDFLKMVRNSGSQIPFIIFTGRGHENAVIQALNAGADFYIKKDGEPDTQFTELINTIHQVLDRKMSSPDQEQRNHEWDVTFQNIAQSAFVISPDMRIVSANKATYDLLGLPEVDVIGKECFRLFHNDNFPIQNCPTRRVLRSKKHESGEIESNFLNKTFLISCTPILNDSCEIERIIHLAADITEQKKIEEEKSRLLHFQHEMLETSAVWIATLDSNGAVSFWNRAAELISGYNREEVLGKTEIWEHLYPNPVYRANILGHISAVLSKGEHIEDFETRIRTKNGDHRFISWYSHNMYGVDDDVIGSIVIGTNSTARKNAEIDLSYKNDELSAANEELLAAGNELRKQCQLLQQHQEALQVSQERLSLALEGSGDALWDWNVDTGKIFFSTQFYALLGFEPDAFPSDFDNWHNHIHPDDVIAVDAAFMEHFEYLVDHYKVEFRMCASDGEWRWILAKGKVVDRDGKGRVIRVAGTLGDITIQKEKTQELHQYADIIKNMQTGLLVYRLNDPENDLSLELISANPASTSILGFVHDDMIGRCINDIFPNLDPLNIPRIFAEVVRSGTVCELPDFTYGDRRLPFASYSLKAVPISGNCVAVLFDDISARKEKEHEIVESEEKYRVLIENSNEMIYIVQDGKVCYGNQRIRDFLDDTIKDDNLVSLLDLVHPEDHDLVERYYRQQSSRTAISGQCEFRVLMNKGVIRWVGIHTVSYTWKGRPAQLFFADDITDRILNQHALEQANKKLNLLSSITRHDILNQLTSLNGFLDLAEEGDGELQRNLFMIRSASEVIRTQIEYTRMYNELGAFKPGWYSLGDIIREQMPAFETCGIQIESSPDDIWIYADPMIGKVFYNLIDNAIKYGEILTKITFSWKEQNDTLTILCEDNGAGIRKDMKKNIFLRGVGKNTGFGLFLAREILSITGIGIEETGAEGFGARFEITVPPGGYRIMTLQG